MKITTSRKFQASAEQVWPLLTNSRMEVPGWFCLGVPQPKQCELPDSEGGVGAERRCISDRGTVIQKITAWEPPHQLSFEMVTTDHGWGPQVKQLVEKFSLEQQGDQTIVTRQTHLVAEGCRWKELGFYFGLKRVHLFVFKNWRRAVHEA